MAAAAAQKKKNKANDKAPMTPGGIAEMAAKAAEKRNSMAKKQETTTPLPPGGIAAMAAAAAMKRGSAGTDNEGAREVRQEDDLSLLQKSWAEKAKADKERKLRDESLTTSSPSTEGQSIEVGLGEGSAKEAMSPPPPGGIAAMAAAAAARKNKAKESESMPPGGIAAMAAAAAAKKNKAKLGGDAGPPPGGIAAMAAAAAAQKEKNKPKAGGDGVAKEEDPRAALMAMLGKRAPPAEDADAAGPPPGGIAAMAAAAAAKKNKAKESPSRGDTLARMKEASARKRKEAKELRASQSGLTSGDDDDVPPPPTSPPPPLPAGGIAAMAAAAAAKKNLNKTPSKPVATNPQSGSPDAPNTPGIQRNSTHDPTRGKAFDYDETELAWGEQRKSAANKQLEQQNQLQNLANRRDRRRMHNDLKNGRGGRGSDNVGDSEAMAKLMSRAMDPQAAQRDINPDDYMDSDIIPAADPDDYLGISGHDIDYGWKNRVRSDLETMSNLSNTGHSADDVSLSGSLASGDGETCEAHGRVNCPGCNRSRIQRRQMADDPNGTLNSLRSSANPSKRKYMYHKNSRSSSPNPADDYASDPEADVVHAKAAEALMRVIDMKELDFDHVLSKLEKIKRQRKKEAILQRQASNPNASMHLKKMYTPVDFDDYNSDAESVMSTTSVNTVDTNLSTVSANHRKIARNTVKIASYVMNAPQDKFDKPKKQVALKNDPEYSLYFRMLRYGFTIGAVRAALQRDGKPDITKMDPDRPVGMQKVPRVANDLEKELLRPNNSRGGPLERGLSIDIQGMEFDEEGLTDRGWDAALETARVALEPNDRKNSSSFGSKSRRTPAYRKNSSSASSVFFKSDRSKSDCSAAVVSSVPPWLQSNVERGIVEGYLRKKTRRGRWVRRWYLLDSTGIYYSHSPPSAHHRAAGDNGKFIKLIDARTLHGKKSLTNEVEFEVWHPSQDKAVTSLRASSPAEVKQWVDAINSTCERQRLVDEVVVGSMIKEDLVKNTVGLIEMQEQAIHDAAEAAALNKQAARDAAFRGRASPLKRYPSRSGTPLNTILSGDSWDEEDDDVSGVTDVDGTGGGGGGRGGRRRRATGDMVLGGEDGGGGGGGFGEGGGGGGGGDGLFGDGEEGVTTMDRFKQMISSPAPPGYALDSDLVSDRPRRTRLVRQNSWPPIMMMSDGEIASKSKEEIEDDLKKIDGDLKKIKNGEDPSSGGGGGGGDGKGGEKKEGEADPNSENDTDGEPKLKNDPKYVKYYKMLKMGLPKEVAKHAMTRDGQDPAILDMDPEKSLKSQLAPKEGEGGGGDDGPPLKDDPKFAKYFKMMTMGLPKEVAQHAMTRDGQDPSVLDLDPNKSFASQQKKDEAADDGPPLKDDEKYVKYFKMMKMGLPKEAAKHAMTRDGLDPSVLDLDPEKSLASQQKKEEDNGPPLKDDPKFEKYFKMLKMGLPVGAVKNALTRDGLDPAIMDLDPEKSLASQTGGGAASDNDPPLKDDPKFEKYFKMLKMGLPMGAVKNALTRDGLDPAIMDLDHNKSVSSQLEAKGKKVLKGFQMKPKPKIRRKKVYWTKLDAKEGTVWSTVRKLDVNLKHDIEEFERLFSQAIDADKEKEKKDAETENKKSSKSVKVIDAKRGMNGDIILRKIKMKPSEVASMVDKMDCTRLDAVELKSLYEFMPNDEEMKGLTSYLEAQKERRNDAVAEMTPCEQYMVAMKDLQDSQKKFQSIIFLAEFHGKMNELKWDVDNLDEACEQLRSSKRFQTLLAMILVLVNKINTGGEGGAIADGFTLDSLTKLSETKAFDNKTTVLHYLVKVIRSTNKDILKFTEDIKSVVLAKGVIMERLLANAKQLCEDSRVVTETAAKDGEEYRKTLKDCAPNTPNRQYDLGGDVKAQRASVKELRQLVTFLPEKDVPIGKMDTTHFERFALFSKLELQQALGAIKQANQNYLGILEYFGEDMKTQATDFFSMIDNFMEVFDKTADVVEKEEEEKLKEARRALAKEAKLKVKSALKSAEEADQMAEALKETDDEASKVKKPSWRDRQNRPILKPDGDDESVKAKDYKDAGDEDAEDGSVRSSKSGGPMNIAAMAAAAAQQKKPSEESEEPEEETASDAPKSSVLAAMAARAKSARKLESDPSDDTGGPMTEVSEETSADSPKSSVLAAMAARAKSARKLESDPSDDTGGPMNIAAMAAAAAQKKESSTEEPEPAADSSKSSVLAAMAARAKAARKTSSVAEDSSQPSSENPSQCAAEELSPQTGGPINIAAMAAMAARKKDQQAQSPVEESSTPASPPPGPPPGGIAALAAAAARKKEEQSQPAAEVSSEPSFRASLRHVETRQEEPKQASVEDDDASVESQTTQATNFPTRLRPVQRRVAPPSDEPKNVPEYTLKARQVEQSKAKEEVASPTARPAGGLMNIAAMAAEAARKKEEKQKEEEARRIGEEKLERIEALKQRRVKEEEARRLAEEEANQEETLAEQQQRQEEERKKAGVSGIAAAAAAAALKKTQAKQQQQMDEERKRQIAEEEARREEARHAEQEAEEKYERERQEFERKEKAKREAAEEQRRQMELEEKERLKREYHERHLTQEQKIAEKFEADKKHASDQLHAAEEKARKAKAKKEKLQREREEKERRLQEEKERKAARKAEKQRKEKELRERYEREQKELEEQARREFEQEKLERERRRKERLEQQKKALEEKQKAQRAERLRRIKAEQERLEAQVKGTDSVAKPRVKKATAPTPAPKPKKPAPVKLTAAEAVQLARQKEAVNARRQQAAVGQSRQKEEEARRLVAEADRMKMMLANKNKAPKSSSSVASRSRAAKPRDTETEAELMNWVSKGHSTKGMAPNGSSKLLQAVAAKQAVKQPSPAVEKQPSRLSMAVAAKAAGSQQPGPAPQPPSRLSQAVSAKKAASQRNIKPAVDDETEMELMGWLQNSKKRPAAQQPGPAPQQPSKLSQAVAKKKAASQRNIKPAVDDETEMELMGWLQNNKKK